MALFYKIVLIAQTYKWLYTMKVHAKINWNITHLICVTKTINIFLIGISSYHLEKIFYTIVLELVRVYSRKCQGMLHCIFAIEFRNIWKICKKMSTYLVSFLLVWWNKAVHICIRSIIRKKYENDIMIVLMTLVISMFHFCILFTSNKLNHIPRRISKILKRIWFM